MRIVRVSFAVAVLYVVFSLLLFGVCGYWVGRATAPVRTAIRYRPALNPRAGETRVTGYGVVGAPTPPYGKYGRWPTPVAHCVAIPTPRRGEVYENPPTPCPGGAVAAPAPTVVMGLVPRLPSVFGNGSFGLYATQIHALGAINFYSARWGVSSYWLTRLAWCESAMNPYAYNAASGASGLMQFMPSTYYAYAAQIGEYRSYWNWGANANVTAYMWRLGQQAQWACTGIIGYYGGTHWNLPPLHPPIMPPHKKT